MQESQKKTTNCIIPLRNHENHEIHKISRKNHENHEKLENFMSEL